MDEQETDDRGARIAKRAAALLAQHLGDPTFDLTREEMIQAIEQANREDEVLFGVDE
jgi:hypothetical protein